LAKKSHFAVFWTSTFSGVAIWQQSGSLRKLNTGEQLQTFAYPKASKSVLYSNDFMAKSGAQTLTSERVTNKQTDRQTNSQKNSTCLADPAAGEIQAPPNLAW